MNWKEKATQLSKEGYSGRAIARMLGKGRTTVLDYLRKSVTEVANKKPSVLFLDIETRPLILQGWQLFNQNFGLEQIQEDWSILSYSAKFMGSDEIFYSDVSDRNEDDLLQELHELLDISDFVVGHNLKKFDLPKIRARMIARGFAPHRPVRMIDTLSIAKEEFKFTSNKLAYLTSLLCKSHVKGSHEKFAGHKLWKEFIKGNPEAIEAMRDYNMVDVTSLEELYFILAPWSNKLPNFDVYNEDVLDMAVWEKDGFWYTNLGQYDLYRNRETGQWKRGRTNLLSRGKRSQLLSNLA